MENDVDKCIKLAVFKPIRHHPERERLHALNRFFPGGSVHQSSREVRNLRDPTTVRFLLRINGEDHASIVASFQAALTP